jgi:hydroxylamine reductase (hybrid-cluster protein)
MRADGTCSDLEQSANLPPQVRRDLVVLTIGCCTYRTTKLGYVYPKYFFYWAGCFFQLKYVYAQYKGR